MKTQMFFSILLLTNITFAQVELEFVQDCVIKTGKKVGKHELGGLSGLAYNPQTRSLLAVSDFKTDRDAHLFLFKLPTSRTLCPSPVKAVMLQERDSANSLQRWDSDGEGFAVDVDGSIYVSSESSSLGYNTSQAQLSHFSNTGVKSKDIITPQAFNPGEQKIPPGPEPVRKVLPALDVPLFQAPPRPEYKYNSNLVKRMTPDLLESLYEKWLFYVWKKDVVNAQKEYATLVKELKRRHQEKQDKLDEAFGNEHQKWVNDTIRIPLGPQHNAGFESLSFDQKSRILTLVSEETLLQDQKEHPGIVRLLRMSLDESKNLKTTNEYYYQSDSQMRVSEILDLGENRLLVLEIRFDTESRKVFSKIFEVDMTSAKPSESSLFLPTDIPILKKRLVIDLNEIEDQLSPSYQRLDNLEGMALGPDFSTGEKSLYLVSDNNRSKNQATQFLIFKLKGI